MAVNPQSTGQERLAVLCRPARQADSVQVIELTQKIWEGDDYIPSVWRDWLADPEGLLAVAESEGQVLGLGKLTRLSDEDWWMEGLRVHPDYEGRGIASQIFDCLFDRWLHTGAGAVRLETASYRYPVHHLCERAGFVRVLEIAPFAAPPIQDPGGYKNFQSVAPAEVDEALTFTRQSQSLATLTQGLIDLYWRWAQLHAAQLAELAEREQIWWWSGRNGLLAAEADPEDEPSASLDLKFLACPLGALGAILEDFRRLAGALGYKRAHWDAPLHPILLPVLDKSGFERAWEHSMYLYARQHPERYGVPSGRK